MNEHVSTGDETPARPVESLANTRVTARIVTDDDGTRTVYTVDGAEVESVTELKSALVDADGAGRRRGVGR